MLFLLVVGVLNEMDWGMNEVWWLVGGGGVFGGGQMKMRDEAAWSF